MSARVLVVDDEEELVGLVRGYLEREGFGVLEAYDGPTALQRAQSDRPDLVVLDLMLPGLDGIEVCRRLRTFSGAYVIMLTARAEEVDKLIGLAVGADDYLTKPFSPRELVARVRALLRRPRGSYAGLEPSRRLGPLTVDPPRHAVTLRGRGVELTPREFGLLEALTEHPGMVFTRNQLLERVWGDAYYDDHVVDVHVGNLRRKLEDSAEKPHFIETVRGVGYRFRPVSE